MNAADKGYVDLHSHYVPCVDDGVRSAQEGISLCQGLRSIGYRQVVATPHIRTAMFDNRPEDLRRAFEDFAQQALAAPDMPGTGLGAEHFCDDVFWDLFQAGRALTYPGGHSALVEFPTELIPRAVEQMFFQMRIKGVNAVLAHPERYRPLFRTTEPIERMLDMGVLPLLDLMSLLGHYGRRPRKAAERMLEEDVYFAACSDAHKPADVERVAKAIERLVELVGEEEANRLLSTAPQAILDGTTDRVR